MKQVSCLAYSSTLMMEVTYSSEMSVDFQRITQHYIPVSTILIKLMFHDLPFPKS
jgi:hypothetical protein